MKERLALLRKTLDLSMEEFGLKLGVGRSTISRLESGTNNFTDQMVKSICREYGVDYLWLTEGEGDMFINIPDTVLDELCMQYELNETDKALVKQFMEFSAEEREAIKDFVKKFASVL